MICVLFYQIGFLHLWLYAQITEFKRNIVSIRLKTSSRMFAYVDQCPTTRIFHEHTHIEHLKKVDMTCAQTRYCHLYVYNHSIPHYKLHSMKPAAAPAVAPAVATVSASTTLYLSVPIPPGEF